MNQFGGLFPHGVTPRSRISLRRKSSFFRTNVAHIFAGDVIGFPALASTSVSPIILPRALRPPVPDVLDPPSPEQPAAQSALRVARTLVERITPASRCVVRGVNRSAPFPPKLSEEWRNRAAPTWRPLDSPEQGCILQHVMGTPALVATPANLVNEGSKPLIVSTVTRCKYTQVPWRAERQDDMITQNAWECQPARRRLI